LKCGQLPANALLWKKKSSTIAVEDVDKPAVIITGAATRWIRNFHCAAIE